MTEAEFLARYPRLWHMAADGSWPSIQKHGLLSTFALLDLYGIAGETRNAILSRRRPQSVTISGKGLPDAVIRDQKPMTDAALLKCLGDDLCPRDWYELLNKKTFFWLSQKRLRTLLGARAYRKTPQVVITLDTASLLEHHSAKVQLARINSGATLYKPQPRGKDTFKSIEDFPLDQMAVELTVEGGVTDVANHVLTVHRVADGKAQELWRSARAKPDDGP